MHKKSFLSFKLAKKAQQKQIKQNHKGKSTTPTPNTIHKLPNFAHATKHIYPHNPVKGSPTQQIGYYYEKQAALFLQYQGYLILDSQLHYPYGEIDLVAWKKPYLVCVEVRYRASQRYGGALYSISPSKQQRLKRAALHTYQAYQQKWPKRDFFLRLDVIAFEAQQLQWVANAISY